MPDFALWEYPATLAVNVTDEHISDGKPSDPSGCPLALALAAALKAAGVPFRRVSIAENAKVYPPLTGGIGHTATYTLPPAAEAFRDEVDMAADVGRAPQVVPTGFIFTKVE